MKILPFTIPKAQNEALIFQEDEQPLFYEHLHRHVELQISYIKRGEGSLVVGDTISNFRTGDLFVLGSNLPHVFRSHKGQESHMLSIFFTETSFGDEFFKTEELKSLQGLLQKAASGIRIKKTSEKAIHSILKFPKKSKLERFLLFIQLLNELNRSPKELLSAAHMDKYSDNEGRRMSAIFEYTMNHYPEKITLDTIAKVAAMTPNAFCKFFKKRTRKTYVTFLNELRIEAVCRLILNNPELSIRQLSEQCGFQNLSNFNRKFKAQKLMSPTQFRSKYAM